jgi:hypothetical protein
MSHRHGHSHLGHQAAPVEESSSARDLFEEYLREHMFPETLEAFLSEKARSFRRVGAAGESRFSVDI